MNPPPIDWPAIEQAWKDHATRAICHIAATHPADALYAGAFWLLYGDYSSLHAPVFALNSEAHAIASAAEDGTPHGLRWHPPDWQWNLIEPLQNAIKPLYQPLLQLDGISDDAFEALWEVHLHLLARVCHHLTESAANRTNGFEQLTLPPGFFVGIIDGAQGDDYERLLHLSIPSHILDRTPALFE